MSYKEIDLNGKWQLINKNKGINIEADVPGSVFYELIKNNIIEDPFYGTNEEEVKWVYHDNWLYKKVFILDKDYLKKENIELFFYGLDTFTEIRINGKFLLQTDNMHRTYRIDLNNSRREFLKAGENEIQVYFKSSVDEAQNFLKKMNYNQDFFKKYQPDYAIPGVESIRKAYYTFGWDWGPKLPDIGIWRDVKLVVSNPNYIEKAYITPVINFKENTYEIEKAYFEMTVNSKYPLGENEYIDIKMFDPKGDFIEERKIYKNDNSLQIEIKEPKLWWTYELGEQNLYTFEISLVEKNSPVQKTKYKVGLRKIELIRDKDNWGESFYFKLNNVPVFAKGADWIPVDNFIQRGREKNLYKKLIDDVKSANMNMLRVWGGGIYEDDLFYELCDKKGILIWQDFAFACKPSPDYEGFIENITEEAKDNIIRLRNHPSLCIWVGNNEIEEGWLYWGFNKLCPHLKENYLKIFEKILPQIVSEYDPQRSYWPSSPSSGGDFKEPQSPDYGDSHFWEVWHESKPFSAYRKFDSRFMSEFGFESFPHMKTIKEFCPTDQMQMLSEIMKAHQKNPAGNEKILKYMKDRFIIPEEFWKQVIISQITQAEAIEFGVEHWRRKRNDNHCMGALYWQLNDCWPVASWSSIDYYGRWKALHYIARRFYNPLLVSVEENENKLEIWAVNDLKEDFKGILDIEIYNFKGEKLAEEKSEIILDALKSREIKEIKPKILNSEKKDLVLFYSLISSKGEEIFRGSKFFNVPKNITLNDPKIIYKIQGKNNLLIKSNETSLYVFINSSDKDYIFSDNYFHMKKGEVKNIEVQCKEGESCLEDNNSIEVFSLYDLLK